MKDSLKWLVVIAMLAIFVSAAVYALYDDDVGVELYEGEVPIKDPEGIHRITYHSDGGIIGPDAPGHYFEGSRVDLPGCYRIGMHFDGWFTDESRLVPIAFIPEDSKNNVDLYASWSEFDKSGWGYTMKVHAESDDMTVDGTYSWDYLGQDGYGYYVQRTTSFHIVDSDGERDRVAKSGYWTDENTSGSSFTCVGTESVNGIYCLAWESDDGGEKQWVWMNRIPLRIEFESNGLDWVLSEPSEYRFDPVYVVDIAYTADDGIMTSGPRQGYLGASVSIIAYGAGFEGWYMDGELLTESNLLSIERLAPGHTYEARSTHHAG